MHKKHFIRMCVLGIVMPAVFIITAEAVFRYIESKREVKGVQSWRKDPVLGWNNIPGKSAVFTEEYKAYYNVNSLGMNNEEIADAKSAKVKIAFVGDSHTFAVGVSAKEAYPKALESMLFNGDADKGVVYNYAVSGYSLGQYLLRIRELDKVLDPDIIVVGFSMATDLYDLIPPRMGGFVYGSNYGRVYFDLDKNWQLVEKTELKGKDLSDKDGKDRAVAERVKRFLGTHSALYRNFKRSKVVLYMIVKSNKIENAWAGISTAVKKYPDGNDFYRWVLAERLLERIAEEAVEKGRKVVVVNIPYLPQVYDSTWAASFGQRPDLYDRYTGNRRLSDICRRIGVFYVDTTPDFIKEANDNKQTLHFMHDGHPNTAGHRLIAKILYDFIIKNRLLDSR